MAEPTAQPSNPSILLDLSAERVVELTLAGRTARHFFRRLTLADWLGYVRALQYEEVRRGETIRDTFNLEDACSAVWDAAALRVEGYQFPDDPDSSGAGWRARLPVGHKVAAVLALRQTSAAAGGDPFDLSSDEVQIRVSAFWNLQRYNGLLHVFRTPTADKEKRFRKMATDFYRVRGTAGGAERLRVPSKLGEICGFYDRLISRTEGYSAGDQLVSLPNAAVEFMDPLHKEAAVSRLFFRGQEAEEEPLAEEVAVIEP